MSEQQSSYRQIMKATSIFGGVQIFNIVIQIIRSKVIAILLGPAGMGIMGLLNSTVSVVTSLTNFGLGTSAVKDIAAANSSGDIQKISRIATVFKRLVWITGLLGTIITLFLSPWLSQLTFGNRDYTLAFIWISITLLFSQLSSGQLVILQGMRRLKQLANANIFGSALGLFITVPLYYFFGFDGIVPGIISTAFATLLLSWFYARKVEIITIRISRLEALTEGKSMLQMGFMISLSGLLTVGSSYIVRVFMSRTGGIEQVGLYNAGFAIINTYVGLIFNAMATDYYPRLSIVAYNNKLCKQTINQQAEISILILAPILIAFLTFINWVIILLYSKQFIAVNEMIYWAALGMFFKAASWCIAFIFLAKRTSKLFFLNELIVNAYLLALNLWGYHFLGLTGLGLSFALAYLFYLIQVYLISKIKFDFSFDKAFLKIFTIQFGLAVLSFVAVRYLRQPYPYIVGAILVGISGFYSLKELDKRLELRKYIYQYLKR
jgi:O-antigen/teichoic acid export membrane protein